MGYSIVHSVDHEDFEPIARLLFSRKFLVSNCVKRRDGLYTIFFNKVDKNGFGFFRVFSYDAATALIDAFAPNCALFVSNPCEASSSSRKE